MPNPEVLAGMRAPRSVRLEDMRKQAMAGDPVAAPAIDAADAATVYVSNVRRYRVQVTAPHNFIGMDGRKQTGGEMIVAEFDEGVYRNNHRDPAVRRLIDETLQANKYFGRFGGGPQVHFWLASDQKAVMEKAHIDSALRALKSLPKEAVEQFVAELRQGEAEDHEMPTADTEGATTSTKKSARPIPAATT